MNRSQQIKGAICLGVLLLSVYLLLPTFKGTLAFATVSLFSLYMKVSWTRAAATQFTLYMALSNLGYAVGAKLNAWPAAAGLTVFAGHSAATYEETRSALEAGLVAAGERADRGDEIGAVARSLEGFRQSLADGEAAIRDGMFKGAAFMGSSAAMMLLDKEFTIRWMNPALDGLLEEHDAAFSADMPVFVYGSVVDNVNGDAIFIATGPPAF